ncbi:M23 family metallopeptidase [Caulobacter sp. NIBR2454]|uniref:M23 family metallopeptidase n=1 Tax=Caulobacter sp. NIBR2454 TaxID=3015996 RepID=UPI0022B617B1|nr:M23 family metallopeptidase [Caulobacter sp. NIBR2454]
MQEFDPRRPAARLLPRVVVASVAVAAAVAAIKVAPFEAPVPEKPALNAAEITALQHRAFAQAEAQPGLSRAENVPVKVRPGETLQGAVQRAGVEPDEAAKVVATLASAMDTVKIKAGMALDIALAHPRGDRGGPARLIGLSLRTSPSSAITVSRTFDGALRLRELEEEVRDETTVAHGEMHGSLFESAARAGATPTVTAQVVKLFSHKVDFSRDIKAGDNFSLVFDRKVTESGRTIEAGDLEYAEIKGLRFYRFERNDGGVDYFDETGKNVRGFLLRTPVDGARITSGFGARRHPILGFTRMHQGIDFGAGSGTPVLAAGDGVVVEAGRKGGYGNWVKIRHNGGWETGYAHLSRYAKGLKKGQRVKQGQLVAYVGSTGMSTGPHLHYEIFNGGRRVNPVGAKIPQGTILAGAELNRFRAKKAHIDSLLNGKGQIQMADASAVTGGANRQAGR